ncbi:MAG TPA: hypothetical protein VIZ43_19385 [Trebonia sp.]
MGWCTTYEPDQFAAAAGGYLRSRAAENTLLLSAAQAARPEAAGWRARVPGRPQAPAPLFGWWEPPDGGDPRGAFVHDPAIPLLISGRAPEMATALAGTLARMQRPVSGVDAPTEVADAFAAAWSQRAGTAIRAHKTCRVYRLTGLPRQTPPQGMPALTGAGAWPPPQMPVTAGRLRVATAGDHALLADWLAAFAAETAERLASPSDVAAELITDGGAFLWEIPGWRPVALATLTRPAAGTVRIGVVYTPPEHRHRGYAVTLLQAVSVALLTGAGPGQARGAVREVVLITDRSRSDHWGGRLGYELVGERAVLRFGPATGPVPRPTRTNAMPRLPTGPLPRLRR